ncbi:MAG: hypothetical protein KAJ47_01500 [Candidatus Aenigmarchaeota archaeon]|nr:hypothetical protein [Candidatus Aenigmarchaeota archaeon]
MKKLVEYNNFWLIWLSCAGSSEGISLFKIQENWGIKTNYLYHKERSLGKPLFKSMLEKGYLKEGKNGLVADFDWIPSYILNNHNLKSDLSDWSLNDFIVKNIPIIHKFIRDNNLILFDQSHLKKLYLSDINIIKRDSPKIFDDIMLFVFINNLIPFCKTYDAEIVIRMIYTFFSFSSQNDFLKYFYELNLKLQKGAVPKIIANEGELVDLLCPIDLSIGL